MSFLGLGNPASGSGKQFKLARNTFSNTAQRATGLIGAGVRGAKSTLSDTKGDVKKTLGDQINYLKSNGLPQVTLGGTAGGLGGSIDKNGNVLFNRSGETQGWIDRLGQGLSTDEGAYNTLLGQIAPGFGQLSQSAEDTIRNDYAKRYGDLRAQLAQRRVLGSSFADANLESMKRQETLDVQAAKADAITKELAMTQGVIQDRTNARIATVNEAFNRIGAEDSIKATLLANTQNNLLNLSNVQSDLAKTLASLQSGIGIAGAGIESQGGIAAGDVAANLGSAKAQTYPQQAQLMAEGKQAQNNSIGTLIGSAFGLATGNKYLGGVGNA